MSETINEELEITENTESDDNEDLTDESKNEVIEDTESGEETDETANEETVEEEIIEYEYVEPEPEVRIYSVILDENNYYTGMACIANYSRFEGGVDVEALPPTEDVIQMKAYKLVEGAWEFDEARYNELLAEEEAKEDAPAEPTQEERITMLEEENEVLTATVDSILTEIIPSLFM